MYTLAREQYVETDLQKVWKFIEQPANLNRITPPDLNFQIVSAVPEEMYEGLIILYRITIPGLGTHNWVTEIKHIHKQQSFVDEQRLGPFVFWYHIHQLRKVKTGCSIVDLVYYQPPFGLCGRLFHRLYIRRNLERIFDFRQEQLARILT